MSLRRTSQNTIGFSNTFSNAGWTKTDASIAATADFNAPDGTATLWKMTEAATTAHHRMYFASTITPASAGHVVTQSIYVKAGTRTWVLYTTNDAAGTICWFDVGNGALGTVAAGATARINRVYDNAGAFWGYRLEVTHRVVLTSYSYSFGLTTGNNVTNGVGDGTGTMYFCWAQATYADEAGEYLPMAGAALASQTSIANRRVGSMNLLLDSNNCNAAGWTTKTATVTVGQTDPLGGTNAQLLTDNSAAAFQLVAQAFTVPRDFQTYCLQFLTKKDAAATAMMGANFNLSGGTGVNTTPRFDPTGTLFSVGGSVSIDLGTGWLMHYCFITNNGTNTTLTANIYPAVGPLPAGSGDSAVSVGSVTIFNPLVSRSNGPVDWTSGALQLNALASLPYTRRPQNLTRNSENFSALWTLQAGATVGAGIAGPGVSELTTSQLLDLTGCAVGQGIYDVISEAAASYKILGKRFCHSLWVCSFSGTATVELVDSSSGTATAQTFTFGTQWTRIARAEPTGQSSGNTGLWVRRAASGTAKFYAVGAQTEQSNGPGAYVKTLTTPGGQVPGAAYYPLRAPPNYRTVP